MLLLLRTCHRWWEEQALKSGWIGSEKPGICLLCERQQRRHEIACKVIERRCSTGSSSSNAKERAVRSSSCIVIVCDCPLEASHCIQCSGALGRRWLTRRLCKQRRVAAPSTLSVNKNDSTICATCCEHTSVRTPGDRCNARPFVRLEQSRAIQRGQSSRSTRSSHSKRCRSASHSSPWCCCSSSSSPWQCECSVRRLRVRSPRRHWLDVVHGRLSGRLFLRWLLRIILRCLPMSVSVDWIDRPQQLPVQPVQAQRIVLSHHSDQIHRRTPRSNTACNRQGRVSAPAVPETNAS